MKAPRLANPLKPNLLAVLLALCWLAWLGKDLYDGIIGAMQALTNAPESPTAHLEAMNTLLLHLVGASVFMPIIAGLVAFGVKLLDEKPEPQPTVPATTHEAALRRLGTGVTMPSQAVDALKGAEASVGQLEKA